MRVVTVMNRVMMMNLVMNEDEECGEDSESELLEPSQSIDDSDGSIRYKA